MSVMMMKKPQTKFEKSVTKILHHHPVFAFVARTLFLPMLILIAVFGSTFAIIYPLSWLMGWL